jgi:NAD(P)-dependent dehydrogenase (short-subunit alcohol dehydrogenase family)
VTTSSGKAGDAVLVTGSSTGLGLETALYLAGRGFTVYATVRDPNQQAHLLQEAERRHVALEVLPLDVTDRASIEAAVAEIVARSGTIFGLVNNAGIGLRGCVEDLTADEIRNVFEANVFGTIAVTQCVLPHLRAAGRGRIVTISSVGGRISSFGLAAYCGSKFALEGFGEALALEIAPFGLQAILIEPGIIKTTRWTSNRGTARKALAAESPYYALFQRSEMLADERVEKSKTQPADVAKAVHHALTTPRPRMHYVVGRPAAAAVWLRRYLPEPLFERVYFGSLLKQIMSQEPSRPTADGIPDQSSEQGTL